MFLRFRGGLRLGLVHFLSVVPVVRGLGLGSLVEPNRLMAVIGVTGGRDSTSVSYRGGFYSGAYIFYSITPS